ncbi:MAG: hypothetical protein OXI66_17350 [Boseongicola sp.]|nr:hypothetical protein [Boseongicola sp.]
MQASIGPLSISERLERLDAITAAGFTDVENSGHELLVHVVRSTEVGQPVRVQGLENSPLQPFRDFKFMPAPHHRFLTRDASK